jgi:hypothetical protein
VAIALVLGGVLCGAAIPGTAGGTICTVLVGLGLIGVVSLVFYDVGLTEDRDRARELPGVGDPGDGADPGGDAGDDEPGDLPARSPASTPGLPRHPEANSLRPRRPQRLRDHRRPLP